jgi:hypothetical protein
VPQPKANAGTSDRNKVSVMTRAEIVAQPIKDAISNIVFDKAIDRRTLIEAIEDVACDVENLLASLKDDERRAQAEG